MKAPPAWAGRSSQCRARLGESGQSRSRVTSGAAKDGRAKLTCIPREPPRSDLGVEIVSAVTISVEATPLERKLVAIVVADVEGYSRLNARGRGTHARNVDRPPPDHRRPDRRRPREISGSAGDSVLAEFASVVDAVHYPRWASSRRSRKPTERSTFQHGQQT